MLNSISIFSSTIVNQNVGANNQKKVLNNKTVPTKYIIGIGTVIIVLLLFFLLLPDFLQKKKKNNPPKKTTETEGDFEFTKEELQQFKNLVTPTKEELEQYKKLKAEEINSCQVERFIDKNNQVKYLKLGKDIFEFIYDDQNKVKKIYKFSEGVMKKFHNSVEYSLAEKYLIYENISFILEQNNQIYIYNKNKNSKGKIYKRNNSYYFTQ